MRIAWDLPDHNFEALDKYQIQLKDISDNYLDELTYCDGSDSTIFTLRYCDVPMSVLIAEPYNLPANHLLIVQVRAHNAKGWGSYSA